MNELVDEGRVRFIGCSNFGAGQVDEAARVAERERLGRLRQPPERVQPAESRARGRRGARLRAPRARDPAVLPACPRPPHRQVPARRGRPGGRAAERPRRGGRRPHVRRRSRRSSATRRSAACRCSRWRSAASPSQPAVASVIAGATAPRPDRRQRPRRPLGAERGRPARARRDLAAWPGSVDPSGFRRQPLKESARVPDGIPHDVPGVRLPQASVRRRSRGLRNPLLRDRRAHELARGRCRHRRAVAGKRRVPGRDAGGAAPVCGRRWRVGAGLGSLAAYSHAGSSLELSVAFAVPSSAEGLLGAVLVERIVRGRFRLGGLHDVSALVIGSAIAHRAGRAVGGRRGRADVRRVVRGELAALVERRRARRACAWRRWSWSLVHEPRTSGRSRAELRYVRRP